MTKKVYNQNYFSPYFKLKILTKNLVTFKKWDESLGYKISILKGFIKNPIFRVRGFMKKPKSREDCLKRGLGQLAIVGLAKKKEWCFLPQCTLWK